ncbi:hypothetical protein [Enterocloster lavalensis]|uniref:hypothetical protein n=1 Tax=Enterocloster lavalensis TaxID=460384 RepID=UPI0034A5AE4A
MVELSKKVRKELRKEAMSWVSASVFIMSQSVTEDQLNSRYYMLVGKIEMCRYLGIITYGSYCRLLDYLIALLTRIRFELFHKNKEVA